MPKFEIEVEGLPEGWDVKKLRIVSQNVREINPNHPDYNPVITDAIFHCDLIVQKSKPRRIVSVRPRGL